jgi:hypothetical protein
MKDEAKPLPELALRCETKLVLTFPSSFFLLPSAFCPLPSALCLLPSAI